MSTQNPILAAAAPALINALQAIQQFETDLGPNPANWVVNLPGAKLKLLGTLALQLPTIATAEGAALNTVINTTTAGWITKLQALSAKPA
jgi:hypothetical protein